MRLADFIEQEMQPILSTWDSFAASQLPAAARMDRRALRDHAQQILLAVAEDLRTPQSEAEEEAKARGESDRPRGSKRTAAEAHAVLRATSGFTIQQLVGEYRALRASVLRLWLDKHPPGPDGMNDVVRFNEAIDQAVAESVQFFAVEVERWRHIFLGVLGHDLRGPLNAIVATSHLIARLGQGQGAALEEHAARILRGGKRMGELLDDLLDFSRSSLGVGIAVKPVFADLAAACRDEVEMQRVALSPTRIDFFSDAKVEGRWDTSRVRQIVGNLVSNAAKYGDAGGTITVRLMCNETEARLSVENAGPPISASEAELLFDPLRRGGASRREGGDRESLGLGLFIVRELTGAHHGGVSVSSADGQTTFTVALPRGSADPAAAAS